MAKRWEYKIVQPAMFEKAESTGVPGSLQDFDGWMNLLQSLGQEGWELISVNDQWLDPDVSPEGFGTRLTHFGCVAYFKRELS